MAGRVALLTNMLPHYRVALLRAFRPMVAELRIFLSSRREKDRDWPIFWDSLDVVVQRSITWTRSFRNVHGYRDSSQIHVPYDTFSQLCRYRPNAILSGEFGMRTGMSALYRLAFPKTVLIIWATLSEHTEATRGRLRGLLRRAILRCADGVFVNGQSGARYIAALGFQGPMFTIPYVVDNALFAGRRTVQRDGTLRLLFTGQLIERKGLHLFLPSLAQWCANHPARSIVFTIAGDGPERAPLQSIPLPPNLTVAWLGSVPPNSLPEHYRAADIFVFPTLGDEWGTVVNEALSAGAPVLGSLLSQAVEELIEEGKNGWLFKPSDSLTLPAALDKALAADWETLETMSLQATASIARLTPETIAARMADAIQRLGQR